MVGGRGWTFCFKNKRVTQIVSLPEKKARIVRGSKGDWLYVATRANPGKPLSLSLYISLSGSLINMAYCSCFAIFKRKYSVST